MKLQKLLLITIVTLFTMTGCCWTDHSKIIKEVAEPMAKELEHFYAKEKRFPTPKERDNILVKIDFDTYENMSFSESNANNYYSIRIIDENTYCSLYLYDTGKVNKVSCVQNPCIDIGQ